MQIHVVCHHLSSIIILVTVTPEMTKPVQPAVPPEIGRDKQPNERNNEIVIELDGENQYRRTQPRANEPQGNPVCAILKIANFTPTMYIHIHFSTNDRKTN